MDSTAALPCGFPTVKNIGSIEKYAWAYIIFNSMPCKELFTHNRQNLKKINNYCKIFSSLLQQIC